MKEFNIGTFDTQDSLYIEASAGTGKTHTIQLMVAKMLAEGTPLKKILIVTYTEKAAGELKDRIRKKIDEVLAEGRIDTKEPKLTDEQMSKFVKAYQDVDNAAIFTIHSFCQKALKEYAYDAGKPFDSSMIDDNAVEDLLDRFIRDKWNNAEDFQELLLGGKDTSAFVGGLKRMFIKSIDLYKGKNGFGKEIILLDDVELPQLGGQPIPLEDLERIAEATSLNDLRNSTAAEQHLGTLAANSKVSFLKTKSVPVSDFIKNIEVWKPGMALFDGRTFKNGKYIQESWPADLYKAFLFFKELKDLLTGIADKIAKIKLYRFLIAHTPELFDAWQEYKSGNKLQSFNDMILSVHRAVTTGGPLVTRLRAQYRYAIIDEFQDTNQLQWDIFRTLFLKEGKKRVLDHSIFVVGDPKQSIYSFQGADVNVYKKAVQEIKNGSSLTHNYRSAEGITNGCNELFAGDFFTPAEGMPKLVDFGKSFPPNEESKKKAPPEIGGQQASCFWLSRENISPDSFAAAAVAQIMDWCSFVGDKTKLQVFDKDYGKPRHPEKLRNVSFKDFAILAKSRSEMEEIENDMRLLGIPYTRYKESNLFRSRECAEWIALFRAINAPDFSSWNRRILSEVLITDFFKDSFAENAYENQDADMRSGLSKLHYCESKEFDLPDNQERMQIASWRSLALKFRYAEMLEKIYQDTKIEYRLMNVAKLQNMARLRQIGNYAVDYLYNHKCSLEDLIRHLEGLARYSATADDENGDLVEKGSDFNAVQVMTIHASKGLEFPVVISVAGFKQLPVSSAPYIYHEKDDSIHLGFGDTARDTRNREELEEWKRLFYVDFTRASSILVLPRYDVWYKTDKNGNPAEKSDRFKHVHFLMDALTRFAKSGSDFYSKLDADETWTSDNDKKEEMVSCVKNILARQDSQKLPLTPKKLEECKQEQILRISEVQKKIPKASTLQYSYSSLAGHEDTSITSADDNPIEKEGAPIPEIAQESAAKLQQSIDTDTISNAPEDDSADAIGEECHLSSEEEKYPRGSKVGDALHNIMEKTRFAKFGEKYKTLDDALGKNPKVNASELANLIEEEFNSQSLSIAKHKDNWTAITTRFVWNTLHAELPLVEGDHICDATFKLVSIPETDHKPEVQFGLKANADDAEKELHRMCKGFIDLLFVHTDSSGKRRYSILDWKSDTLESYTPSKLKAKVDSKYSIQRVLYSYCLIQWLKQFYAKSVKPKDGTSVEQAIFEEYFGGIYYAFLRGTKGSTSRGIYVQTWKDYATLEKAYENIKNLMGKQKKEEK